MKEIKFSVFLILILQLLSVASFGQSAVQDTVKARLMRAKKMNPNNSDAALNLLQNTLNYSRKKQDKTSEWSALQAIGLFYLNKNQLDDALSAFQKSITVAKTINDLKSEGLALINIGNTYLRLKRLEKAKSNYTDALSIFKKLNLKINQAKAIANIGNVNTALELHEEGLANFKEAYKILDELGEEDLKSQINLNIGYFYLMKNQGKAALPYVQRGLKFSLKAGQPDKIAMSFGNLAYTYSLIGDFENAFKNYQNCIDTAQKYNYTQIEYDTYKDMVSTYEKSGNYVKAMEYQTKYYTLRDSIIGKETQDKVSELEIQFAKSEQNREIKELQQGQKIKNLQLVLLFISLGILGLIGFLIIQKQRDDLNKKQSIIAKNKEIHRLEKELIEKELQQKVLEQEKIEAETKILKQQEIEARHYAKVLENSNKELEQFAHVVSHDLREPLRMVKSYMGLIKRVLDPETLVKTEDFFHYAIDGAARMDKLIQNILNLASVQQQELKLQSLDLNEITSVSLQDLHELIKEKNATVHYQNLPTINGDASQMTQLFENIISNGLKYNTSDQPTVSIHHKTVNDKIELSFTDNGVGIPKEYQTSVFKMFQRLENISVSGTGIGLATCQKIVERHNGSIQLASEVGKGTTFTVIFPCQ